MKRKKCKPPYLHCKINIIVKIMVNFDSHIILNIEKTQVNIMPAGRLCRNNFALGKKNPTLSICTLLKLPHLSTEKGTVGASNQISNLKDF
jgi:hypothetical protein